MITIKGRTVSSFSIHIILLHIQLVVDASLNLHLPESEVRSLFGADNMQLYYIRDGIINHNAIAFETRVQDNKDFLEFIWEATQADNDVGYDLSFVSETATESPDLSSNGGAEKRSAIETPQASISMNGHVPNSKQNFTVSLRCTGEKAGNFTVSIVFKFRFADNPTEGVKVELKRMKKCVKLDKRDTMGVSVNENNVVDSKDMEKTGIQDSMDKMVPRDPVTYGPVGHSNSQSTDAFYISISVVTFIIILSVIVVRVWHAKTSKKREHAETEEMISMDTLNDPNQYLRLDRPNNATLSRSEPGSNASWMHFTPIINDLGADIMEIRSKLSCIAVPESDVVLNEVLQEGTFSKIYKATLEGNIQVLVKTVTVEASEEQTRLLLFESYLLKGMHNRNVLTIRNVVLDGPGPPLVLFPYTKGGNLKRYLKDIKFTEMSSYGTMSVGHRNFEQASTQDLVEMGIQVANGMTYLAKRGLVHKDLATRNCVIDMDLKIKISDNALSRDLFPADYCCLGDNENRPIRWLAMESLIHRVYSTASDVWSFGVLLWELQSLAAMPYNDIDDFEMSLYLRDGFRLSQPINCPDHLYNIMAQCWHYSPDKRPPFGLLLQMLTEFNAELGEYV